ncbi:hypothetical protein N7519_008035 [Penicillium mononematosum]|uniref:uncharacterized protein n=1 Tax=Penicillium mononematosum TaxID=268346 RepID=UPI0025494E80|nr:uncharacterized protein N7519_008035 [Penicillium mononematosum]KAJ6186734.1 hypothetical protein N7519_008035 [Penicillium mononematosum]
MHFAALLLAPALVAASSNIPYEQYILAPESRDLIPPSVHSVNGSVTRAKSLTQSSGGEATFYGVSSVTYDFGKNVAGLVSLDVRSSSSSSAFLGVTFSESSLYISNQASDATADAGLDTPLWFNVGKGAGDNTTATVSLKSLRVKFTAAPDQDLRAYTGYFHSDDELINKIWYAGAYTNQLATINPKHGNSLVHLGAISSDDDIHLPQTDTWWNNYTITNGSSTTTDGAKRDRLVWPGDMSIALESIAVSTGDLYSVRTALESLFVLQKSNGQLPYAGKGFLPSVSYTYHLHSLIGASYLYRFSGDKIWLSNHWSQYKRGLEWAISSVDETGLANITSSSDWLRFGMGAHNIEANAILYFVLQDAQFLATELNDKTALAYWSKTATKLKIAANEKLWDASSGLYFDNETTTMHPQDGNAWAIKANLTQSTAQAVQVSNALKSRWGKYGAPAPEAGKTVSPFISGFELQGHYLANKPDSALDLMRLDLLLLKAIQQMDHCIMRLIRMMRAFRMRMVGQPVRHMRLRLMRLVGDLTFVDAGFETAKGKFSTSFRGNGKGVGKFAFVTPANTTGEFVLAGARGSLVSKSGQRVKLVNGKASGLKGGSWKLRSD